jgi:hypothetical protein
MSHKRFQGIAIGLLTLTVALTLTRTVRADGGEAGSRMTVNGYQIGLIFAEPARVGVNKFHVQITDSMGMPMTAADVEVTAMMSAEDMSKHEHAPAGPTSGVDSVHGMSDMPGMDAPTPAADMNMSGMNMSDMAMPAEPSTHDTPTGEHAEPVVAEDAVILMSALKPGVEAGEYIGEISLDKTGAWTFNVHFASNGQTTEAEFPIEVLEAVRNYGVLVGIFGFNATVILTAAVLKRKAAVA